MKKIVLFILLLSAMALRSQNGSIYGKISDSNGELVPFASVLLMKNDSVILKTAISDMDGKYSITGLQPDKYSLKVSYVGYRGRVITSIVAKENSRTIVNVVLDASGLTLDEVVINTRGARQSCSIDACRVSMSSLVSVAVSGKKSRRHGGRRSRGHMKKMRAVTGGIPASYGFFGRRQQDFNTEDYKKIDDNEFKEVTKDPLSTMSIDVDRASYSNMRRFITQGNLPPADAVRVEEMINYFSYEYPQPTGDVPFSINTEFTDCPWNKNHQIVHIGIQGKEIKTDKLPANNLVFLIDVSGSMSDPNKLPLVKSGLRLLVDQLRSEDKVSLVVYAGNAGLVLAPTSGAEKEKIMQAIENLEAGGSTAGGQGIELAYAQAKESFIKEGNNRVILATDGDFNVGVSSDGELVRLIEKKREEGVFLTVLGFGTGNYKDSKMEQLADKGNGNYAYIDDILEAKKVLVKEMGGTLVTIAKDVKIQIEFNPAKVKAYRLVGYENRLLNKEDFNDDKKDAGELGSGHTVTAIYEIVPAGSSDQGWASVDELKYQKTVAAPVSATSNEILTVKFRYKEPKEHKSKLITQVVTNSKKNISENCQFACAVAEFGMILRDSKFKGEADFKSVLALAKQSKGKDEEGYRAEFIRLVETAQLLKK